MNNNVHKKNGNGYILECQDMKLHIEAMVNQVDVNPYMNITEFINQCSLVKELLPNCLSDCLARFRCHGNHEGVLLLKSLPLDPGIDNVQTPYEDERKPTFVSEILLSIICSSLGDIFGYKQIHNGSLYHNIVPKKGLENEQSFAGSKSTLMYHTEQHFHPHSPDYLLLYCIRNPTQTSTFYSSISLVDPLLSPSDREELFNSSFRAGIDHVFGNFSTERGNGDRLSILYGDRENPFIRFDEDLMVATTKEADSAMQSLRSLLHDNSKHVVLQPGDLLIVDNRRAVHGRSAFTPSFDGYDRWLQRTKVLRDIEKASSEFNFESRVITTSFDPDKYRIGTD